MFAEYHVWEHSSGSHDISTEEYHVPAAISEHIDYVTPGVRLRSRRAEVTRNLKKRAGDNKRVKPLITQLAGFPHPNSTTCSIYVTAECTRGQFCAGLDLILRWSIANARDSGQPSTPFPTPRLLCLAMSLAFLRVSMCITAGRIWISTSARCIREYLGRSRFHHGEA